MARFSSRVRSATDPSDPAVNGRPRPVPHTRAAGLWVALAASALVLLLLLIFILQNGQRSDVHFLGAHGQLPMGVALLLAAVFGVLLVTVPATVRILQLRRLAVQRDIPDSTAQPERASSDAALPKPDPRNSEAGGPHPDGL
jgi:uncharacterized integral membrane protein